MQRLISLAVLALLAGGGWTYLQNVSPGRVQQAVQAVGSVIRQSPTSQQQPVAPLGTGYSQPPAYGGGYANGSPAFAPAPQPNAAPTIRIAAFNIQTFGQSKASKPYVMDAIARVVRSFDVVAIQEIRTQDDRFIPNFLRDYVNKGATSGGMYDARVSPRLGRTRSTEQYAFLFNTATIEVHPQFCSVIPDPNDQLHREPYVALFRTRIVAPFKPFTFTLINIHTDPDEAAEEIDALYSVYRQVQRTEIDEAVEDDVILLGDLNTAVPAASRYTPNAKQRPLSPRDLGLLARIPGIAPLIRNEATNVRGSRLHDNLLIPSLTTIEYLDHGVMDLRTELGYSLTQEQVLEISDHLPVWGKFSAIEGDAYRNAQR